jgi:hypothetical protein
MLLLLTRGCVLFGYNLNVSWISYLNKPLGALPCEKINEKCRPIGCKYTLKIALGAQVADGQPQNGEPVQFGEDRSLVRQETGQRVQLGVESLPVPFARIALARTLLWRRLQTNVKKIKREMINNMNPTK